jgi:hypothetical protein
MRTIALVAALMAGYATASLLAAPQDQGGVAASLGQPGKAVDLGSKKIYIYKDLKITFVDGRVSDVQ